MLAITVAKLNDILRVLQALNPDATETKGEWWAKFTPPYLFSISSCTPRAFRAIRHIRYCYLGPR